MGNTGYAGAGATAQVEEHDMQVMISGAALTVLLAGLITIALSDGSLDRQARNLIDRERDRPAH